MAAQHRHDSDSDRTLRPQQAAVSHWQLLSPHGVVTSHILDEKYEGSGTQLDPYIISFLENDPGDPKQLPRWNKWLIVVAVSLVSFTAAFGSSVYTGVLGQVQTYFEVDEEIAILGLSLYVLGFVLGPLLWAPLGEYLGRQKTLLISYSGYTALNGGTVAAQNIQTLLVLRFFAGCFSSATFTNSNGNLADIFEPAERGLAFGFYAATPFMGPVLAPMIGGFLGTAAGWRWVFGFLTILSAFGLVVGMFIVPETYGTVLLHRRACTLSAMTGKTYISRIEHKNGRLMAGPAFRKALARPWAILFLDPIVLLLSLWISVVYGTLYLFLAGFPYVYQEARGWTPGVGGLALLGIGGGTMVATVVNIPVSKRFGAKAKRDSAHPEVRLEPAMMGAIFVPAGIFWFAWTNNPSIPWPSSVVAGSFFGFGMVIIWTSVNNYLADAYKVYAASALAGQVVMRSVFGAIFPLFTGYMYRGLGIHWASSVPGFLAIALAPLPYIFYAYGYKIRRRSEFAQKADVDMAALTQKKGQF